MTRTAVAIRHVNFEDLGSLAPVLEDYNFDIQYHDVGVTDFSALEKLDFDLLVVLGGPIGVHDINEYPFLAFERQIIRKALDKELPLLGICLGAQLISTELGANVIPMKHKEIGFSRLDLNEEGKRSPLRHLGGIPVLHWHGDTFETAQGCVNLASTPRCANQAFQYGSQVLGLQFHLEVEANLGFERWLVGHACEMAAAGVSPVSIRQDALRYGGDLSDRAQATFKEWLRGLR